MKKLILTLAILSAPAYAIKLSKSDWEVQSGKLIYHVHFPLKKSEGTSESVRGKGRCDAGVCQFLIAVPIKSFLSGDGNRDNHMLEVTRAADHPMVVVKVKLPQDLPASGLTVSAEVGFAGKTHVYDNVAIAAIVKERTASTKGRIPMKLSDFGIERPRLLAVPIDDDVPVDFELTWN